MVLAKSGIGQSQEQRTGQHLAALEMQVRARIAAAEARPESALSSRLHAARQYRDATSVRHAEALKTYKAAQEQLAAAPEARRSLADRVLGRQPPKPGLVMMERAVAVARDDLIAAEHAIMSGEANLARVEKAESADRAARMGEMETQRRAAMVALAEIITAQRMTQAYPGFVFCGAAFVVWAGAKVERKRKGPRNPWAVDQWGIPLHFG